MLGIFALLVVFASICIVIASPFFVLGYIIKSLKNKSLSNKIIIKNTMCMLGTIVVNVLIIATFVGDSVPDVGGLAAVVFIFAILFTLDNLFVLWLFYCLYYIFVNKNNSEVDNKKPIKIFIIICLLLIPIIIFLL